MHEYKRSFSEPLADLCESERLRSIFRAFREQGSRATSPVGYTDDAISVGLKAVIEPLSHKLAEHWENLDKYTNKSARRRNAQSTLPFDPELLNEVLTERIGGSTLGSATEWRLRTWVPELTVLQILQLDPEKPLVYEPTHDAYKDLLRAIKILDPRAQILFKSTQDLGLSPATCEALAADRVPKATICNGQLMLDAKATLPITNGWTLLLSDGSGLSAEERRTIVEQFTQNEYGVPGRRKPDPKTRGR